ncbi:MULTISPECIES: helix-turn-helix domain-containing protein [Pyrobaculum]|jgi:probable regulatory domain-containing protein|uniref:Putative transcription regulator n=1 Tax=Pyrobaculum ferrireducens TaxID=1104324 RepID=G7VE04_9CREN|nr:MULTISPECIES: helix-turn-helix domain-containing protein [Pyrobaculum]AET32777.1 putative transcription regulator [Pyrobaculum ferrireducens]MCU7787247.1 helix-turn-helix domain-containing protein [Pyrobaculum sp. 3827-6]
MAEIPLKPASREDIRRLESALLVMSLYDRETVEAVKDPAQRVTWVDSLYVAAAALARERAGMPPSRIAEELGVSEATVRRHLKGETKAGQLVAKVYEKLLKEGFRVELPPELAEQCRREVAELREKLEKVKKALAEIQSWL